MAAQAAKRAGKKTNFFAKFARYLREVKIEMKKVIWPTKKQVRNNTAVVIVSVIVVGVVIWVLDVIFKQGLHFFIK